MMKVKLENLTKKFGEVIAVDNLSLDVREKEFLILLGSSGCGKTTALRCIAGLETPDEGKIYIGNELVNGLPPGKRDVAMVFQSYALYPHMTVFDNLAYPLKVRRSQKDEIKRRVKGTAELLEIENLLGRKPGQLSGGQAQRVALGRAIIREPRVFLMDEPLASLDAKLRAYMRAELKKLQKDLGVTTIYVTHDQVEAMTMGDRVAVMSQGKLMQVGSSEESYYCPRNLFVAGFIGSPPMNFIDVIFETRSDKFFLRGKDFCIELPRRLGEMALNNAKDSKMVLGIRPEDVVIGNHKGHYTEDTCIEAEVYVVEPLGRDVLVNLRRGDLTLRVLTPPPFGAKMGDNIQLSLNTAKIHMFDRKTGQSLLVAKQA
ncbi:ABC transporter ATP-binding protein [Dehalococcoidia bacterium]|nr:ABC transporter ATP-binding protein [Dehalococcoidia bacterium]